MELKSIVYNWEAWPTFLPYLGQFFQGLLHVSQTQHLF